MEVWKNAFRMKTRTKTLLCLTSVVALVSVGGVATHASFNDTGKSTVTGYSGRISPAMMTLESWPYLFESKNMVAGKTYTKTLTVKNNGNIPMKYSVVVVPNGSSDAMLSSIPVTAVIDSTTVYTGTLKDFKISTQTVDAGASKVINITFKPVITDAVRDLQGTMASPQFTFTYTS